MMQLVDCEVDRIRSASYDKHLNNSAHQHICEFYPTFLRLESIAKRRDLAAVLVNESTSDSLGSNLSKSSILRQNITEGKSFLVYLRSNAPKTKLDAHDDGSDGDEQWHATIFTNLMLSPNRASRQAREK